MANKQPNFVLKLSLEEMALRRAVINFWSEIDILSLIEEFLFLQHSISDFLSLWNERVGERVKSKISNIVYPESLKRRMNLIVAPVGLEIMKWKHFIAKYMDDSEDTLIVLKQLCWTTAGTIDYGKTAEKLVRLQTIDEEDRFGLACAFCLADSLPAIWETLPEEYKQNIRDDLLEIADEESKIKFYWAYVLKGENTKPLEIVPDFHQRALDFSLRRGNKEAAEYFLQELSNEFRNTGTFLSHIEYLVSNYSDPILIWEPLWLFPEERRSEIVFHLLSLLPPERRGRIVKEYPVGLFRRLMHWPWKGLFSENADIMWEYLSETNKYEDVLHEIRMLILNSGYYCPEVMQECFLRSPGDFRKVFVNQECARALIICKFLDLGDSKTFRVIFRCIDNEDRLRLISSYGVFRKLDILLAMDERHLVEFFIRGTTVSKVDRESMKEAFMGFFGSDESPSALFRKRKWQQFFGSIDEPDTSSLKRKSDDQCLKTLP